MVTFVKGDLLNADVDIICHQVNLQGVMGGGLAYQIAKKYPNTEKAYKKYCDKKSKDLGDCLITYEDDFLIANCFSQEENFDTNYEAVYYCFIKVKELADEVYKDYGEIYKIGIPFKYGCGIANGDWDKVLEIITKVFEDNDVLIYIKE